jgi:hypothetical protein
VGLQRDTEGWRKWLGELGRVEGENLAGVMQVA